MLRQASPLHKVNRQKLLIENAWTWAAVTGSIKTLQTEIKDNHHVTDLKNCTYSCATNSQAALGTISRGALKLAARTYERFGRTMITAMSGWCERRPQCLRHIFMYHVHVLHQSWHLSLLVPQ
jgi:hypothetical protein